MELCRYGFLTRDLILKMSSWSTSTISFTLLIIFTTPYCPQSNGTVEVVSKEVLRAVRSLSSELRIDESEWKSVLPLVQSILSHAARPSLNGKAPITAFTGLPVDNPLRTVLSPNDATPLSLTDIQAKKIVNIQSLVEAVDVIHRDFSEGENQKTRAGNLAPQ